jgi:rod shape-determining protein MreC
MLYGLVAVVLMAMDQRGHYVPKIRYAAEYLAEPVYHVVEWPVRAAGNLFTQFSSRRSLRHENDQLKELLLSQGGALQRLDALAAENKRLRSLFEGAQSQEFEYQFAELLQVDLDPFSHKVLINRGFLDDVNRGQAVIDGDGVMGQVEEVHLHFSTVRLISDPNHALPVQINRTGLRTIAFGSGETGNLSLTSVPREADVRDGDLIVTSGLGDRFPGGYPVARVTVIDREEGKTFAQIEASPLAALGRGREVLLIVTPPAEPELELAPELEQEPESEPGPEVDPEGEPGVTEPE